jgi:hypothetical protein
VFVLQSNGGIAGIIPAVPAFLSREVIEDEILP